MLQTVFLRPLRYQRGPSVEQAGAVVLLNTREIDLVGQETGSGSFCNSALEAAAAVGGGGIFLLLNNKNRCCVLQNSGMKRVPAPRSSQCDIQDSGGGRVCGGECVFISVGCA